MLWVMKELLMNTKGYIYTVYFCIKSYEVELKPHTNV